jgi:crotonobetainyl-CoA:carnitine CoA-transferase CaiB-like acyl-CoA transferase
MMLADLGADVIKVESLDGDHGRQFGRVGGVLSDMPDGVNTYFEGMNRNKRGIALDLKNPRGKEIMHELVSKSDVFVENFRKGVAERLGIGYEDLRRINDQIVYGSASGYGPSGPDAAKPAFALTGEARSGALWWSGPDDGAPYQVGIADQAAGVMLSYGILGALVARERFGYGQKVDVSHLGSMMWTRGMQNGISLLSDREFQRQGWRHAGNVLWNYYECADGEWIAFSMSQGDRYWPAMCRAMDKPEWLEDDRFDSLQARYENREFVIEQMAKVFKSRPRDEWEQRLSEAGDLIYERVQRTLDLQDDPQVVENKYIIDFNHPVLGQSKWLQTPVSYSENQVLTKKMAPAHGEDTESVLIELLNYTWDDIATLQEERVIL